MASSAASSSDKPALDSSDIESEEISFINARGETLCGTLQWRAGEAASSGARGSESRQCLLVCHGMLVHRRSLFYPSLCARLLLHPLCSPIVSRVLSFDFAGHGQSEGEFLYGGYGNMVADIDAAAAWVAGRGMEAQWIVAHSMSASAALLHAAQSGSIPHVCSLSARFDMRVEPRFSKEQLLQLIGDGVLLWQPGGGSGKPKEVRISLETYQERLRTDMSVVRLIGSAEGESGRRVHTLLVHGTEDEIIPHRDAQRAHALIVDQADLGPEESMHDASRDSAFEIDTSAVRPGESVTSESFTPPLRADLPHLLVSLVGGNHNYNSSGALDALIETLALWINAHSGEKSC